MAYFVQQCLNGLHSAAIYALLAFGYVAVNGLIRQTNLAYGPVFALSAQILILGSTVAYGAFWLEWWAAIPIGFAVAALYAGAAGAVLSRSVLLPLRAAAPNAFVVATLGAGIVLMELSRLAADSRDVWLPPLLSTPVAVLTASGFAATLTLNQLLGVAAAFFTLAGLTVMLRRTDLGRRWRAVSDDPLAAALCGVDAMRVIRRSVILSCLLAALAGAIAALHYGNIGFGAGMVYGLKALFVTAAGSYSEPDRASLGAFAYGMGEGLWSGYFPMEWRDAWMLAFLAALLVLRRPGAD